MGIAFVITGLVLIVTGIQDTYAQLGTQLKGDMTGPKNFTYWVAAIGAVGALGYIPALKGFSTWFMALILVAIMLSKGQGFFSKFQSALATGPTAPNGNTVASVAAPTGPTSATANPAAENAPASPASALGLPGGSGGFFPSLLGNSVGNSVNSFLFGNP